VKILLVHNRYKSTNFGGEDIVFDNELEKISKAYGKKNISSYVVSNDNINRFKLFFSIWFSVKHYKNVKNTVLKKQIDIVHIHNFFPLLSPAVFLGAKLAGAKIIWTIHNYRIWCIAGTFYRDKYGICEVCSKKKFSFLPIFSRCYRNSFSQSVLAYSANLFYRFLNIYDNIDKFQAISKFQQKKIISLGLPKNKVVLKHNFVDSYKIPCREKLNYLYIGRLEESKGIIKLLKLWRGLDLKFKLSIIGDGQLLSYLQSEFKMKNVTFLGKCSRIEVGNHIASAKYLIQPSLWYETFGLTIIEAMSYGVPVIGFKIGTRMDFIKEKYNGFFINDENFLEVMSTSYDYVEYEKMCSNSKIFAKNFNSDESLKMQEKIYVEVLREKH